MMQQLMNLGMGHLRGAPIPGANPTAPQVGPVPTTLAPLTPEPSGGVPGKAGFGGLLMRMLQNPELQQQLGGLLGGGPAPQQSLMPMNIPPAQVLNRR